MSDVWGVAPRLLQDHSPTGELPCAVLVEKLKGSGESLVTPFDLGDANAQGTNMLRAHGQPAWQPNNPLQSRDEEHIQCPTCTAVGYGSFL